MFGSQKRAEKIYDNAGFSKFTVKAFRRVVWRLGDGSFRSNDLET